MGYSKRQLQLKFGFNARTLNTLIINGILTLLPDSTPLRPSIDPLSVDRLQEHVHYIVCRECGGYQSMITPRHLKMCSGQTLEEYQKKHGGAEIMSELCSTHKIKTPEQRVAQSIILKQRFQSPEGEVTRKQISEASLRMLANGGWERAARHLRQLNQDPQQLAFLRQLLKNRWESGEIRQTIRVWHEEHQEESQILAANARRHIQRKKTKLHLQLKEALLRAGIESQTEYEVEFYALDEAIPEVMLSIEADGCYWHGCVQCGFPGLDNVRRHDKAKESFLRNRGWEILHFPGHQILEDPDKCAQQALEVIRRLQHES